MSLDILIYIAIVISKPSFFDPEWSLLGFLFKRGGDPKGVASSGARVYSAVKNKCERGTE